MYCTAALHEQKCTFLFFLCRVAFFPNLIVPQRLLFTNEQFLISFSFSFVRDFRGCVNVPYQAHQMCQETELRHHISTFTTTDWPFSLVANLWLVPFNLLTTFVSFLSGPLCKEENVTHVILFTYKRSGSTLVGEMFKNNPDVFYIFEPLHGFKWVQIENKT